MKSYVAQVLALGLLLSGVPGSGMDIGSDIAYEDRSYKYLPRKKKKAMKKRLKYL